MTSCSLLEDSSTTRTSAFGRDGYYMSSNDFTPPGVAPFLGAGFYSFERVKLLAGDPTAKVIAFSRRADRWRLLPTNLQGYSVPPAGTPNLFFEWFADEFGPEVIPSRIRVPAELRHAALFDPDSVA